MKVLERVDTAHNQVEVLQLADGSIDFNVVGATHATWHPSRLLTGHAWDALTFAALLHPGQARNLLMLGLGGGTVLRQIHHLLPGLRFTAVDIDGDMVRLARQYMALDELSPHVVLDDAFAFLERDKQTYDILIDDLYRCGEDDVERPRAVHADSMDLHLARLAPDGLLAMNFVLGKGHQRQHQAARAAFFEHFPHVRAIRPPLSHNETLVGTRRADGFRDSRALRALAHAFPLPEDQRRWKELRNLKLR